MIRRFSYIVATIVALIGVSCQMDNDTLPPMIEDNTPEGWVKVEFKADAPIMTEVVVRSADPDGIDVQNLTLFCFNDYGLYIAHVEAQLNPALETPSLSGSYTAIIPEDTRIVHFVGNQNPNLYDSSMFVNRTEDEIQDDMVGASGMIIYWSRFIFNDRGNHQQQLASANGGQGIKLIRNQAKISIANGDSNPYIAISGWTVTNVYAYGTTAPYHSEYGFPTEGTQFVWPGEDYVTIPENRAKLSDIVDVTTKPEEYIFEHENRLQDPVSVIIKGRPAGGSEELYYRVTIIDEMGEQLMIRRNHHYKINIMGALTYGSKTFDEALSAPATNNIWVNVEDWVNEISFDGLSLSVEQTSVVLGQDRAGTSLELKYAIESESALTQSDIADVTWESGNTVAAHNFNHTFAVNGNRGEGTITIQLLEMGDSSMLEGRLIVKKGRLQRSINIVLIKTQKFTPVWAATQIYGGELGELATFKFNVPENFPFFPFKVYISVNSLDVRTETTGRVLPVVRKGEDGWYGQNNELGYKYVYTVTEPGTQRLYFHSILTHEDGGTDNITLEAEFFESVTKQFQYATHQNTINVENLGRYNVSGISDESIYYRLVPRKVNAPVLFDVLLENVANGEDNPERINAGVNDEFFIYTRSLDTIVGQSDLAMFNLPDNWQRDCHYYAVDDSYWQQSSNGRMVMFKPVNPIKTGDEVGHYTILMKTNTSRGNDIVRIASNNPDSYSAITGQGNLPYGGNTYRSFIFEISTYRPFRFAAQVAINGGEPVGTWNSGAEESNPDSEDHLEWTYLPNQRVDINLDITSFEGTDGQTVDPFGTAFDIYIDAPMLEIDQSRLSPQMATKLRPHPTINGRFIYSVDASREEERMTGNGQGVKIIDGKALSQEGERKSLPFITNGITTAGEIVISSQREICEFFEKRFVVSNQLIEGVIEYQSANGAEAIPQGEFVSFAVERTGVRIGSLNVVADGRFTLNLRAEYSFTWNDDPVTINYIKNGEVYEQTFASLKALYERVVINNETVLLEASE